MKKTFFYLVNRWRLRKAREAQEWLLARGHKVPLNCFGKEGIIDALKYEDYLYKNMRDRT